MSIFTNAGKTKLNAYLSFEVLKCSAFAAVLAELLVEQLATRLLGGATVQPAARHSPDSDGRATDLPASPSSSPKLASQPLSCPF